MKAETSRIEGYNTLWVTLRASYNDARLREEDPSDTRPQPMASKAFITVVDEAYTTKFDGNILLYIGWKERMTTAILRRADIPDEVKVQLIVDRLVDKAFKFDPLDPQKSVLKCHTAH
uniref:Uncharacterized protein n=1 Tax=Acrobeloides nanus TaxID=290746 RepID=A0A914DLG3_9BILA